MLKRTWEWVKYMLVGEAHGRHAYPEEMGLAEDDAEQDRGDGDENPYYDDYFNRTHPEGFPVWQNHETTAEGWPALREATVNDIPVYDELRSKLLNFLGIYSLNQLSLGMAA